eukprot:996638-Pyramimonas_sp.AAC.1
MSSHHAGREWEWAQPPFVPADIGMPNIVDGLLPFAASPQLASIEDCPKQGAIKEARHDVELKAMQFNAKSMYCRPSKGARGKRRLMRTQILKTQFANEHLHLIGVEGSRNARGVRMSGPFLVLASGALDGGLGCELWVNIEEPLARAKGKEVTLKR